MDVFGKPGRQPDAFERFYICRNLNRYSSAVCITSRYNHRIDKILLSNALHALIEKNSVFHHNFFTQDTPGEIENNNGSNYSLRSISKIEFDDVVKFQPLEEEFNEETLYELIQTQIPLSCDKPIWRIIIHEGSNLQYVSFCFDHTLLDGNSGKHFHIELLKELANFSEIQGLQFVPVLFDINNNAEFHKRTPPSTFDLVDLYHTGKWFTCCSFFKLVIVPSWLKTLYDVVFGDHPNIYKYPFFHTSPCKADTKTRYKLINVKPTELEFIKNKCKVNNVTLTPYITTVAMYALQEKFFPHYTTAKSSFKITIAADGRRYYPSKKSEMKYGLFVSGIEANVGPFFGERDVQIESVTSYISKVMLSQLHSKYPFKVIGLLNLVNVWSYMKSKLGIMSRDTITVSNLGLCDNSIKNWNIEDLIFGQCNGIMSHIGLSSISTPKGGLNICIGYLDEDDSLKNVEIIDDFAQFYKKLLLSNDC